MKATVTNRVAVSRSPRVQQMESLFDVPPTESSETTWEVDLPIEERDWNVGLIVGPSGAGKSTIARELFGDRLVTGFDWPDDRSILDAFPDAMSVKDVVNLITSVGFGSPPSWLRPFRALSTGEQFRVSIARALAEMTDDAPVVVDEFTSTVDRQVAKVASHTIQKALRRTGRQFVAVTCHYDVVDWLQPDWVYQPHAGTFEWRSLQRRPRLDLVLHPVRGADAWPLFRPHHYLSGSLMGAAECYVATVDGTPVAFTSWVHMPHPSVKARNIRLGHRLVVLPDWQGLGIAGILDDWAGELLYRRGFRYHNTVAHPAMIAHYSRSPRWRLMYQGNSLQRVRGVKSGASLTKRFNSSRIFQTVAFEYAPTPDGTWPVPVTECEEAS